MRTINDAGLSLVKSFESFQSHPYQDEGGIWTIGYGHTHGVTANSPSVSEAQASDILWADLQQFADYVSEYITADLNDNQFSALVALTENCGTAPLLDGLGQLVNKGEFEDAASHFLLWDKEHIDGELVPSAGLLRRRKAEMALFLTPIEEPATHNID
jgi:lysozyme